jgi:aspartate carbamoyltransferase regulatory subunit
MHMQDKKLEVSAIENGTVIDHIPANALFKVISILNLAKIDRQITFGTNFDSKNIIRNYMVVEKKVVEVPEDIIGIVKCMNPKCITNNEKIVTKFRVVSRHELKLKCHYCEKITDQEHMEII